MSKPVIVCVDDQKVVLDSLRDQLTRQLGNSYVIEVAESAEEALEIFMELTTVGVEIPLIVSDQIMPGMKGDELLVELHRQYPKTLKVLLTGQASIDAVGRAVNSANLYRYIAKPWDETDLLLTVQEAVRKFFQDKQLVEQNVELHNLNASLEQINSELEMRVQKRTEELRLSEAENRAILAALPDLILQLNREGRYLKYFAHGSFRNLIPDDVVGKLIYDILPPEIAKERMHYAERAWQSGEIQVYEQLLEVKDERQYHEVRLVPINDEQVLIIVRDISDRKLIEIALQAAQEKSERLLLNILPQQIAECLKQNQELLLDSSQESFIAEQFDQVTVLFADIVGFTEISSHISPRELVGLLNRIFSGFDHLTEKYGLEKIKTIGDAYMVVGGLPNPQPHHAEAIADMALEMLQQIGQFTGREGKRLTLRLGINVGAVVAGVIGRKKFIYDLWGDTVNIASRMESHGETNMIQVTEAVYHHLKHQYEFTERGAIAVKGKGEMPTYWLMGKKF